MAYGIMGGSRNSHMLTYQTTRIVKCIHFDGESAVLFGTGQLDTQMLHLFGNVTGPPPDPKRRGLWSEYGRAIGLCNWLQETGLGGPGWGYEGIVRMNTGFEMIWCDFASPSLRLISHLNITAPLLPPREDDDQAQIKGEPTPVSYFPLPPTPTRTHKSTDLQIPTVLPGWELTIKREPFLKAQTWDWFVSAVSHYGSTGAGTGHGETRVKVMSCGFLNYYSPKFSSQAIARLEQERESLNLTKDGLWMGSKYHADRSASLAALTRRRETHTLEDVTHADAVAMKADSERVLLDLLSQSSNCSGMDWTAMANEIVRTYSHPLSIFLQAIRRYDHLPISNQTTLREWMVVIREQTHGFLAPFLQYPNGPPEENIWKRDSVLFRETYSYCRFHHTRLLDPQEGIFLGPEETTLKWAIEETTSGICGVLVDIGLSVEGIWQRRFNDQPSITNLEEIGKEVKRWAEGIEELMAWLGWAGEWVRCEEKCKLDEECFIPMWPLIPVRQLFTRKLSYNNAWPGYEAAGSPGSLSQNKTRREGPSDWFGMFDRSGLWNPQCVNASYFS